MSSSISTTLIIIFILSKSISTASPTSSSTLIQKICSSTKKYDDIKYTSCVKTLQSDPRIVSAKNLLQLSIEIIKSGISKSTHTRRRIKTLLNKSSTKETKLRGALQDCKLAYDLIIGSFKSALAEIKEKEYDTATYDLLIASTDNVHMCEQAVASGGIKDEIILRGNKIVPIFGLSAYEAVDKI